MTLLQKQKIKSRFTIILFAMLGVCVAWLSDASAEPQYFVDRGCTASSCHDGGSADPVVATCDGCHAHGAHPNSSKGALNIAATTDSSAYTLGDTISITVSGGYRTDWVRVNVYDDTGTLVAQSSGVCDGSASTGGACSEGDEFPITLTATASATGSQVWTAAWYGNDNDSGSSAGGSNATGSAISTGVTDPGWLVDVNNANHGQEIVAIAAFTVSDAPAGGGGSNTGGSSTPGTVSSGGGGGLSWPVVLLLFVVVIATLYRDKTIKSRY